MNPKHPLLALTAALCLLAAAPLSAVSWLDISEEDMAATECPSDPDAGAEVLYKRLEIDMSKFDHRYRSIYIRQKVYKKGAIDKLSRVNVIHSIYSSIQSIHARVIKPDGTIETLDRSEVQKEKFASKGDSASWKTSFSIPNISPGDIIEYQYSLILDEGYYTPGLYITFQEIWPIRKVEVRAKPFTYGKAGFKWTTMRCDAQKMKKGKDDFYELTMTDLPAFPDEPHQIPDRDGKAWLEFFTVDSLTSGEAFWKRQANKLMSDTNGEAKPTSKIKAKVAELLKGVSQDKKLVTLYDFCRTDIINSRYCETGDLSEDERKKLKWDTPADKTLEQGYGNPANILTLFCAMAQAAGFDARMAAVSNRANGRFTPALESMEISMNQRLVAIKDGDSWQFADPGARFYPFGELNWKNEGAAVLIADKKEGEILQTPFSDIEKTSIRQNADFELHEDGTLTGSVKVLFAGHMNAELKSQLIRSSREKREEQVESAIEKELSDADVSNLVIQHIADPLKPAEVAFDISIPRYAEKIGDRLFLKPSVFQKSSTPMLVEQTRVTDLFFEYRDSERDEITIKLPDGYELEEASAPKPFEIKNIMTYDAKLSMNKSKHTLIYSRAYDTFGVYFPAKYYAPIKSVYDDKHRQDQHTLTLKKSDTVISEQPAATSTSPNA